MAVKKALKFFSAILPFAILALWYLFFLYHPVNFAAADLGRHLKNGQMVISGQFDVLSTNFYSYTEPEFSLVNHHWFFGVVFYFVYALAGFAGVLLSYILLSFLALLFVFAAAVKLSNKLTASIVSFCLIPLMVYRAEVRPEIFSYLFSAIYLFILIKFQYFKLGKKWLVFLPVIALFWVNLHLGFVFSFFFIGVFLLENLVRFWAARRSRLPARRYQGNLRALFLVLGGSFAASLANPNFYRGLFEPFMIFREYGYDIVEHKSIQFLVNYGLDSPVFFLVKITIAALALSFLLQLIFARREFKLSLFMISAVFSLLAVFAVRNIAHFAFLAIPVSAYNIYTLYQIVSARCQRLYLTYYARLVAGAAAGVAIIFIFLYNLESLKEVNLSGPIGLYPGIQRSAEFFTANKISGPIFNNYDIGGYLIFNLYPQHKLFIDNRPEAYPSRFFKEVYILMQENEAVWRRVDSQYHFNVIYFYRRDVTPWGQNFLIQRVNDDEWAPVYVDAFNIIFVRNSAENAQIIQRYRLPKEIFGITSR